MAKKKRLTMYAIRLSEDDRRMLLALSEKEQRTAADTVRRLIRRASGAQVPA